MYDDSVSQLTLYNIITSNNTQFYYTVLVPRNETEAFTTLIPCLHCNDQSLNVEILFCKRVITPPFVRGLYI